MPKTYTTIPSVSTGDVYQAAAHNNIATTINNHTVPPICIVRRTTDQTGYTSYGAVTWESTIADTDGMWAAGSPTVITIQTAGLYLCNLHLYLTGSATITSGDIGINVNGTGTITAGVPAYSTTAIIAEISGIVSLSAGQTISAQLGVTGGSAYVIKGSSNYTFAQTRLSVAWIGRTS